MSKKLKFVPEELYERYTEMTQEELITELKIRSANLKRFIKEKKESEYLKELNKEIAEYRKDWKENNPQLVEDYEATKEAMVSARDAKIMGDIKEKKDLEGGFNDAIKGAKEYVDVLVDCLEKV